MLSDKRDVPERKGARKAMQFDISFKPIDDMQAMAFVNGIAVGRAFIQTRIVEVARYEWDGRESVRKTENREIANLYFRSGRDGFKRKCAEVVPGNTIHTWADRLMRVAGPQALRAYLHFYHSEHETPEIEQREEASA